MNHEEKFVLTSTKKIEAEVETATKDFESENKIKEGSRSRTSSGEFTPEQQQEIDDIIQSVIESVEEEMRALANPDALIRASYHIDKDKDFCTYGCVGCCVQSSDKLADSPTYRHEWDHQMDLFWKFLENNHLDCPVYDFEVLSSLGVKEFERLKVSTWGFELLSINYILNIQKWLSAVTLPLDRNNPRSDIRREAAKKLANHPLWITIEKMSDWKIYSITKSAGLTNQEAREFLRRIYIVREVMDDNTDYGYKSWNYTNVSESWLIDLVQSKLIKPVGGVAVTLRGYATDISQWLKEICAQVIGFFKSTFGFYADCANALSETIENLILSVFCDRVKGLIVGYMEANVVALRKICLGIAIFIAISSFAVCNFISNAVARRIISGLNENPLVKESRMVAESGSAVENVFEMFYKGFAEVNEKDYVKIGTFIKEALGLMTGGTVVSNTFATCLVLLPSTIKFAMTGLFGDKETKVKTKIEHWRMQAQALTSLSKIQHVVVSTYYKSKVRKIMKEGNLLMREIKFDAPRLLTQSVMQTYTSLFKIYTNMNMQDYNSGGRSIPFSFHISGKRGVGKSKMLNNLLRDSMGFGRGDTFVRPLGQTFEAGYIDQPVYVIDEFLVEPDSTKKNELIANYLGLVSNLDYRPNYATVDDPNSGIKGNVCRPKVVVTLNNNPHDNVDNALKAFYRRRRFVIDCVRSDRWVSMPDSEDNCDLSLFTTSELGAFVWMKFHIFPGERKSDEPMKPLKTLDYRGLVEFLSEQYELHLESEARISEGLGHDMTTTKSPAEVIDEVFRDVFDLPVRNFSFAECCFEVIRPYVNSPRVPEILVAEGRTEEASFEMALNGEDDGLYSAVAKYLPNPKAGLVSAALVMGAYALKKYLNPDEGNEEEITFIAQSEKPTKETAKGKAVLYTKPLLRSTEAVAEGCCVPQCNISLYGTNSEGTTFKNCLVGTLVKDRWILIVNHQIKEMSKPVRWVVNYSGTDYEAPYNPSLVFTSAETDISLVYFDCKQFPQFKDRIRYFLTAVEIERYDNSYIQLCTMKETMTSPCRKVDEVVYQCTDNENKTVSLKVPQCLEYHAETGYGMCGSAVKAITGPYVNRILGIHVAGSYDKTRSIAAYATLVSQEQLQSVVIAAESNIYKVETVPLNQVVNTPLKSKLEKTFLHGMTQETKQPAILNPADPRSNGVDPIERSLEALDLCDGTDITPDLRMLEEVSRSIKADFKKMEWYGYNRILTMKEAVCGIPKYLASIKTRTSAGYPLCLTTSKPGKKDFVWFDENGEGCWTSAFESMVETRVEEMLNYSGESLNNRFLGYMKDELRKLKKIMQCQTRMIFANELVFLVAARRLFGSLMIALQNNYEITGFAIGLNQFSEDMHRIKERFKKCNYLLDADYAGFDQHFLEIVEKQSYGVMFELALENIEGLNEKACKYFYVHETKAPIQIKNKLYYVKCSNKSGCVFTTLVNCMVNKHYIRYSVRALCPTESYSENFVDSVCGDDNILGCVKSFFEPDDLAAVMKDHLGQEFTPADKSENFGTWKKDFKELTFLGAHPRIGLNGLYTGAMRKDTLEETPKWTRDHGVSIDLTCQQMIDYASQWDEEYFNYYTSMIKEQYLKAGIPFTLNDNYYDLHSVVASRVADSNKNFYRYIVAESGLTQISSATLVNQEYSEIKADQKKIAPTKSFGAQAVNLNYGVESFVRRATLQWSSATPRGDTIDGTYTKIPFGLLTLLDDHNLQNMPFEHTMYSVPDVEILFQVNGTPMQQGLLVAFFTPFDTTVPSIYQAFANEHALISPNGSVTTTLTIPFRHFTNALKNQAGLGGELFENMGSLWLMVASPLTTISTPTTVDVTLYSRFKSEFYLPTPAIAESNLVAQGGNQSVAYNIEHVVGNIPIQNNPSNTNSTETEVSATIPLDNPPLGSGAVPVMQQFSGMSTICGVEPTVVMGEHPATLCRQPDTLRSLAETNIEEILKKRNYLRPVTISTEAKGDRLLDINLNSLFSDNGATLEWPISAPLAILNSVLRWKADIIIDIVAVKTQFHSFRLLASLGYGYTGVVSGTENTFITQVLDFNNETSWASVKIPYNNRFEYCRTFEGRPPLVRDVTEYGLGTLALTVSNELRYANNVSTSVELLIFARFENPQLIGIKPINTIDWTADDDWITKLRLVSESGLERVRELDVAEDKVDTIDNTDTLPPTLSSAVCRLNIGEKFEYAIKDVIEFGRRHTIIDPWNGATTEGGIISGGAYASFAHETSFNVFPRHWLNELYAGWSGTLKYRIFVQAISGNVPRAPPVVSYFATPSMSTSDSGVNTAWVNCYGFNGDQLSSWNGSTYITRKPAAIHAAPTEMLNISGQNGYFIDISIPFYSQYNYLPTRTAWKTQNWHNGRVSITWPAAIDAVVKVYQAFGDDFRYHAWSPVRYLTYQPYVKTAGATAPTTNSIIGLHVVT